MNSAEGKPDLDILRGAFDLHIHAYPDLVPRAVDSLATAREALEAGMGGILLKDHTTSTVGRAQALEALFEGRIRVIGSLTLNPAVGSLNPGAVEAALRSGARVIFFPTYGAANHIARWGVGKPPLAYPLPPGFAGDTAFGPDGRPRPGVVEIVDLIREHDGILATGHLAPEDALALLYLARERGVGRRWATHITSSVTAYTPEQQERALKLGAWLEHCYFAVTPHCPNPQVLSRMAEMIRLSGPERVVLTSDLGQKGNPKPVEGLALFLRGLMDQGVSEADIRRMVRDNPAEMLGPV